MGFPNHTGEIEYDEDYDESPQTLTMNNPVNKYDYRKSKHLTYLHE